MHAEFADIASEIETITLQPFPETGEVYEYEEVSYEINECIKYRLKRNVLEKHGLVYHHPNSDLSIYSPSNDLCLWKSLASLAYINLEHPFGCQDSMNQAKLLS